MRPKARPLKGKELQATTSATTAKERMGKGTEGTPSATITGTRHKTNASTGGEKNELHGPQGRDGNSGNSGQIGRSPQMREKKGVSPERERCKKGVTESSSPRRMHRAPGHKRKATEAGPNTERTTQGC